MEGTHSRQRGHRSHGPEMEMHGSVCSWAVEVILATLCVREGSHEGRKAEPTSDKAERAKQRSACMLLRKWAATKSVRAGNRGGGPLRAVLGKGSPGRTQ